MISKVGRNAFISFVLVVSVAVGAATAVAQGNRPRTVSVLGNFSADPVNVMFRDCVGEDGPYREFRGKWAGTIDSSDDRLSGILEFMAQSALVNLTTGRGTFLGPFSISDLDTGRQKARGEFSTVVTEGFENHGFAIGNVINQGGPADNFFARFQSTLDSSLHVEGVFGNEAFVVAPPFSDPRTPAVIQGGHCSGSFTKVP
jgi:hypothetical protein